METKYLYTSVILLKASASSSFGERQNDINTLRNSAAVPPFKPLQSFK